MTTNTLNRYKNFIPQIRYTTNYDIFKKLEGNRDVGKRKAKILESINSVGYVPIPIIVNEKYEVIDGQGRLEAAEELGIAVCYAVYPGLTIGDCIALNAHGTNWTMPDYIRSHAARNNANYVRLMNLASAHPNTSVPIISAIAAGCLGGPQNDQIKSGAYVFPAERYVIVDHVLTEMEEIVGPIKSKLNGRVDKFIYAVCFALEHTNVDYYRLKEVIQKNASTIAPIATTIGALKEIERLYNYHIRQGRMYFAMEYDRYNCEAKPGYEYRWSPKNQNLVANGGRASV